MEAIEFPEVNNHIGKNQPQVNTLPAYVAPDSKVVVCFDLSDEDIAMIVKHRRLWYHTYLGPFNQFAPMNIFPVRDYFTQVIQLEDGRFMLNPEDVDDQLEDQIGDIDGPTG